ncbi:unnamed protein product [Oikopleura dioica]|uniref:EGF-like domain-containing protein n=1 Tax=Oikopleura dioica TaxID=34765 RepID=E4XJN2_OIKDI|nr:unnamed protein product [Oikopleura dioica]
MFNIFLEFTIFTVANSQYSGDYSFFSSLSERNTEILENNLDSCESGYFGDDCTKLCGHCKEDRCGQNGECLEGCENGWKTETGNGNETVADCSVPICVANCDGPAGSTRNFCVRPNECVCGEKNWSKWKVPQYGSVCYSLRSNGLKGAIFALVILILSIYTCHRVQTHLSKKRVLSSQIRGYERVAPQRKSRVLKRSPTVSKIYEDRHQDLGTYRRIEIIEEEM